MPNWVDCRLNIYGPVQDLRDIEEKTKALFTNYHGEQEWGIDLTKLCPMPQILEGTRSPAVSVPDIPDTWSAFVDAGTWDTAYYEERVKDQLDNYARAKAAYDETGYYDWYSWCVDNWGAKWPPSDVTICDDIGTDGGEIWNMSFCFNSPWSPPTGLVRSIAELYPNCGFVLGFTEEGKAFTGAIGYVHDENELLEAEYSHELGDENNPTSISEPYAKAIKRLEEIEYDWEHPEYDELYAIIEDADNDLCDHAMSLATEEVLSIWHVTH